MKETPRGKEQEGDVETALLDAELFLKYQAPERALKRLKEALQRAPRSIQLRERLREIAAPRNPEEAARQCLSLASLYIERDDLETAHDRLVEAKDLDPRISIAPGLEAIRRARNPNLQQAGQGAGAGAAQTPAQGKIKVTFAGDLSVVSIFDAIQVIENSRLTGALSVSSGDLAGRVLFNDGRIVGAQAAGSEGEAAFRNIVQASGGSFEFEKVGEEFPVTINAASNTNLILDSLRQLDEEKM